MQSNAFCAVKCFRQTREHLVSTKKPQKVTYTVSIRTYFAGYGRYSSGIELSFAGRQRCASVAVMRYISAPCSNAFLPFTPFLANANIKIYNNAAEQLYWVVALAKTEQCMRKTRYKNEMGNATGDNNKWHELHAHATKHLCFFFFPVQRLLTTTMLLYPFANNSKCCGGKCFFYGAILVRQTCCCSLE